MVDSLLEIEVAYSLLQEEQKGNPIDANYHKLKTDLQVNLSPLYGSWSVVFVCRFCLMMERNS